MLTAEERAVYPAAPAVLKKVYQLVPSVRKQKSTVYPVIPTVLTKVYSLVPTMLKEEEGTAIPVVPLVSREERAVAPAVVAACCADTLAVLSENEKRVFSVA